MIRLQSRTKRLPAVRLRRLLPSLLLAGVGVLAGCQRDPTPWLLTDIGGHMPALAFDLTDDHGKPVSAEDYRGKVVLLYFGYTHCPDVCPLTLARLHVAMRRLGELAEGVRILFVSVDPARDTPALLGDYVRAFDPRAVGLTGKPAAIEALSKRYRSAFTREPAPADGGYEVSHSSAIYIFDRAGQPRLLATLSNDQNKLVHDLRLLLSQENP